MIASDVAESGAASGKRADGWAARALAAGKRLISGAGVGGMATGVDLLSLTLLVEALGLSPAQASIPALATGAAVQFIGCRHLVFDARDGSFSRQFASFALVELVTLALNALLFAALIHTALPYAVARLLSTFGVFVLFSFPAWHWVFRRRPATAS